MEELDSHRDDPLLQCLSWILSRQGIDASEASIRHGLPVDATRLTPSMMCRAAEKFGFSARIFKKPLGKISSLVLPAILVLENGDACILTAIKGRNRTVVFPHVSDKPQKIKAKALAKEYAGYVIYLTAPQTSAEEPGKNAGIIKKPRKGHWFWSVVRQFWTSYFWVIIAAMLINVLALASPLFVMNVYDRVIPNLAIPTLWTLAAGVTIALVFDFILKTIRSQIVDDTGKRVDMVVGSTIFEHSLNISMKHRPASAGAFANQLREFETVRDFFTSSTVIAFTDFIFIGVFLFVMSIIVGPIAIIPLVAVPVVLVFTLLVQIPLGRAIRKTQAESSVRHSILIESTTGIESVRAVCGENRMQKLWETALAATARSSTAARFWSMLSTNFTGLVQQAVSIVVIVWGVYLVGDGAITVGALIASNILAGRALAPLGSIASTIARSQQSLIAYRGLNSIMALPLESDSVQTSSSKIENGKIEFSDITFTYPDSNEPALKNISFTVEPGERIGIIGRIGSGKTTVGKMLAGFYTADEGTLLVDGSDIQQYAPADLREGIGYAAQETDLFAGTLRDNITIGAPGASNSEIERVAGISGVSSFASLHEHGLEMRIAERGRNLSGGQKQAVALARILIRNPRVLFLDEPSASMDTSTQSVLVRQLGELSRNDMTLIISTHQNALLKLVERLFGLE